MWHPINPDGAKRRDLNHRGHGEHREDFRSTIWSTAQVRAWQQMSDSATMQPSSTMWAKQHRTAQPKNAPGNKSATASQARKFIHDAGKPINAPSIHPQRPRVCTAIIFTRRTAGFSGAERKSNHCPRVVRGRRCNPWFVRVSMKRFQIQAIV